MRVVGIVALVGMMGTGYGRNGNGGRHGALYFSFVPVMPKYLVPVQHDNITLVHHTSAYQQSTAISHHCISLIILHH